MESFYETSDSINISTLIIMDKEIFYKYDFYTLEQKYIEYEFVESLDRELCLHDLIEPFIKINIEFLLTSGDNKKEFSNINFSQIETSLSKILSQNFFYKQYCESNSEKNLFQRVLNKFVSRIFDKDGFNDEKYIIQNYIHTWLEKRLALAVVKDSRFSSVKVLLDVIEKTEMLFSFQNYLIENIPRDWIKSEEEWTNVKVNSENIWSIIRTFDKTLLDRQHIIADNIDDKIWGHIHKTTRNSDYISLNREYSFKSQLLFKKNISLWIKLWDNLQLTIIQDCIFQTLHPFDPKKYLELLHILTSKKVNIGSDLNILLLIFARNFFEKSRRLTEQLAFYENTDRITPTNEFLFVQGQKCYKEWLLERPKYYEEFIKTLVDQTKSSEIQDWIFSYKPNVNDSQLGKLYNEELELLTNTYKLHFKHKEDFDQDSLNLQKFNFYVDLIKDNESNLFVSNLLKSILSFVNSDRFFWDKSYSEIYLKSMKGIGFLVSLDDNPVLRSQSIIRQFKITHQGWNPKGIDFNSIMKETFIYCGITFLFEYKESFKDVVPENFFKEFLDILLVQNKYSQVDNSEYYQQPLHLMLLVSSQVMPELKEYAEQELILNYDDLFSLLSILVSNKDLISNQSKKLLKDKLKIEFIFEKRKLNNKNMKEKVQKIEYMVKQLNVII